mmetsp:Transcript_60361/g.178753  ORF Transcript_60361/g.178753 Transcript_60361/m.178753 type:complete len:389 (-) Transcript_60361:621-1787(-)
MPDTTDAVLRGGSGFFRLTFSAPAPAPASAVVAEALPGEEASFSLGSKYSKNGSFFSSSAPTPIRFVTDVAKDWKTSTTPPPFPSEAVGSRPLSAATPRASRCVTSTSPAPGTSPSAPCRNDRAISPRSVMGRLSSSTTHRPRCFLATGSAAAAGSGVSGIAPLPRGVTTVAFPSFPNGLDRALIIDLASPPTPIPAVDADPYTAPSMCLTGKAGLISNPFDVAASSSRSSKVANAVALATAILRDLELFFDDTDCCSVACDWNSTSSSRAETIDAAPLGSFFTTTTDLSLPPVLDDLEDRILFRRAFLPARASKSIRRTARVTLAVVSPVPPPRDTSRGRKVTSVPGREDCTYAQKSSRRRASIGTSSLSCSSEAMVEASAVCVAVV